MIFCPFSMAFLLKEKGFDEICSAYYILQTKKLENIVTREFFSNSSYTGSQKFLITAPTEEQVVHWLNQKFNLSLEEYDEKSILKILNSYRSGKETKEPKERKISKKKKK